MAVLEIDAARAIDAEHLDVNDLLAGRDIEGERPERDARRPRSVTNLCSRGQPHAAVRDDRRRPSQPSYLRLPCDIPGLAPLDRHIAIRGMPLPARPTEFGPLARRDR